ncbi:MAG: tellurite resistance TerB family protein [Rhodospirillaceae bacterium]|nr:tellurite resistance TerB family protein [Rhodospirillaceae bacterium]MEA4836930.1 tellurite resistance TerB family protein [Rhodospirillaceae bacterium]
MNETTKKGVISPHAALVYTMVLVSAADRDMSDAELRAIGQIVHSLPVFDDYDTALLPRTAEACAEMLGAENGLENAFTLIRDALPPVLIETAYVLACDIAAADGDEVNQEKLRVLEMMRDRLDVDRLAAAAIEHAAAARFRTL